MIFLLIAALGGPWPHNTSLSQAVVMASDMADNPLIILTNFGTLGIWVLATMIGWQPTRAEVRRLDAEIARLVEDSHQRDSKERARDQAIEALVSLMTSRTLPTLATAVAEMPQATQQAVAPSADLVKRLEDALARVERVRGDERST